MNQKITFINPNTYASVNVPFGICTQMIIMCVLVTMFQLRSYLDIEAFMSLRNLMIACLLSHIMYFKYVIYNPRVLGFIGVSTFIGVCSSGISLIVTAFIVNKFFAESFRSAGWKVSDAEGNIGEYSSRFLALDEYKFSEADVINRKK